MDLGGAGGGDAGSVVVVVVRGEGVEFGGGGVVCGCDEGEGGFEGDAGEGWESDAEGAEDVGDWEGEVVVAVEGVGGEGGEEEEVLCWVLCQFGRV